MDFNVLMPVVKAGKDKRGRVIIHGVASDASVDLQGEITEPAGLKSSLPYLRKFGKFNDDHRPVSVGEVTAAEVVSKGELVKRGIRDANQLPDDAKRDEVLYVKGPLDDKVPRARYYAKVLASGARLGLSIQGAVLEKEKLAKASPDGAVATNKRCL